MVTVKGEEKKKKNIKEKKLKFGIPFLSTSIELTSVDDIGYANPFCLEIILLMLELYLL